MVAIRDSVAFELHAEIVDPQGRYLLLACLLNSTPFTIVAAYVPNTGQLSFFTKLMKIVRKYRQGNLVLCGDFNCIPDVAVDSTAHNPSRAPKFPLHLLRHDLYDVCSCLHAGE